MDKNDYLIKSYRLLNDANTYERIQSNPLKLCQANFNRELKNLLKNYGDLYKKFSAFLPSMSYFYGLPKLHKPNIPLRPIISNVNFVT